MEKKAPVCSDPACKDNLLFVRVATCQTIPYGFHGGLVDVLLSALGLMGFMSSPKMSITMAQDVIPKGSYNIYVTIN